MTLGEWIRDRLVAAGSAGVTCADLHVARKQDPDLINRGGTYNSFARFFHWYKQLGYIEETGVVEASESKGGGNAALVQRKYFRISSAGLSAVPWGWIDPIGTLHPEWEYPMRKSKYYTPTGRPRGRPKEEPKPEKKVTTPKGIALEKALSKKKAKPEVILLKSKGTAELERELAEALTKTEIRPSGTKVVLRSRRRSKHRV